MSMRMNTTRLWMIKFRVLEEEKNGELFQVSQLVIIMCFQEHGISSARENLIGLSGN